MKVNKMKMSCEGLAYLIFGYEMDDCTAEELEFIIKEDKKDLENIVMKKRGDCPYEGPDEDFIALFNKKEIEKLNLILCKINYKSIFGWIIGYLGTRNGSKINLNKLKHSEEYRRCIKRISKKDIRKLEDFLKERQLNYIKGPAEYLCAAEQSRLYVSIWR